MNDNQGLLKLHSDPSIWVVDLDLRFGSSKCVTSLPGNLRAQLLMVITLGNRALSKASFGNGGGYGGQSSRNLGRLFLAKT